MKIRVRVVFARDIPGEPPAAARAVRFQPIADPGIAAADRLRTGPAAGAVELAIDHADFLPGLTPGAELYLELTPVESA